MTDPQVVKPIDKVYAHTELKMFLDWANRKLRKSIFMKSENKQDCRSPIEMAAMEYLRCKLIKDYADKTHPNTLKEGLR